MRSANDKLLVPVFIACIWITSASADEIVISDVALIAGGTFVMGTAAQDVSRLKSRYDVGFPGVFENEIPAHEITISDFRIDKFEVTDGYLVGSDIHYSLAYPDVSAFEIFRRHDQEHTTIGVSFYY